MERRSSMGGGQSQDYRVGGRVDLLELRVACEVFLSQIDQEFFSDAPPSKVKRDNPILSYLDLDENQISEPEAEMETPLVH
jgi:hypothetical protein